MSPNSGYIHNEMYVVWHYDRCTYLYLMMIVWYAVDFVVDDLAIYGVVHFAI
jgi:hypothetical protein